MELVLQDGWFENREVFMIHENKDSSELTQRAAPLLRAIAVEIQERTRTIRDLETRLHAFDATRQAHRSEVGRIEASLAVQRRELRQAEKELRHMGWTVDDALLVPLVQSGRSDDSDLALDLLET